MNIYFKCSTQKKKYCCFN